MCNITLFLSSLLLLLLQVNRSYGVRKCNIDYALGNCTRLADCPHLVTEIYNAGSPIPEYMLYKLEELLCGYNGNYPLVCCVPPDDPDVENRGMFDVQDSNQEIKESESNDARIRDVQDHPNLGLLPTVCGVRDVSMNDKIVGGSSAGLSQMPWMVLLSYQSVRGKELKCDGTLINEWYVLTAAHCVTSLPYGLELTHVVLGEYDLYRNPDCEFNNGEEFCAPPIKTVAVDEVIPHRGFNKDLKNDIALIRLAEPANFSSVSVKPICLPVTSKLQNEKLVGRRSYVTGWGKTENSFKSSELLVVSLPVITKEACQTSYEGIAIIYDQQLCAGGAKGKDSCGGDSGGPLVLDGRLGPGPFKKIQRGIVSYGTQQCGTAGIPGVYTNVAYYMDWILNHMHI